MLLFSSWPPARGDDFFPLARFAISSLYRVTPTARKREKPPLTLLDPPLVELRRR